MNCYLDVQILFSQLGRTLNWTRALRNAFLTYQLKTLTSKRHKMRDVLIVLFFVAFVLFHYWFKVNSEVYKERVIYSENDHLSCKIN